MIDAVRWVLGESSAKHLRGETMQDVIFNGSGERKPVNRASVELVFDNSLGKAAGAWSQVRGDLGQARARARRRLGVLHQQHARAPRDVADIFLGTGLGGARLRHHRAGHDLAHHRGEARRAAHLPGGGGRAFRSTANAGARPSCAWRTRARTCCAWTTSARSSTKQLEHLEGQAEVASRYRDLGSVAQAHAAAAVVPAQAGSGQSARARARARSSRLGLELEAETAKLRELEASLEQLRAGALRGVGHRARAQGALYEVNAEAARLEQALAHLRDSRRRVENQLAALDREREEGDRQNASLHETLTAQRTALDSAIERVNDSRARA